MTVYYSIDVRRYKLLGKIRLVVSAVKRRIMHNGNYFVAWLPLLLHGGKRQLKPLSFAQIYLFVISGQIVAVGTNPTARSAYKNVAEAYTIVLSGRKSLVE